MKENGGPVRPKGTYGHRVQKGDWDHKDGIFGSRAVTGALNALGGIQKEKAQGENMAPRFVEGRGRETWGPD